MCMELQQGNGYLQFNFNISQLAIMKKICIYDSDIKWVYIKAKEGNEYP